MQDHLPPAETKMDTKISGLSGVGHLACQEDMFVGGGVSASLP